MGAELGSASIGLERLYRELMPAVYRMAFSYLKDPHESEDVVQEAFLRLASAAGPPSAAPELPSAAAASPGGLLSAPALCPPRQKKLYRKAKNNA